ncbi:MAG: hypothetical protein RLO06_05365 [Parvibaculum sp.]
MANISKGAGYPATCCFDPYIPSFEQRLAEKNYTPGTIKTYRETRAK